MTIFKRRKIMKNLTTENLIVVYTEEEFLQDE